MHKLLTIIIASLVFVGCGTTNYKQAYRTYCPNCNAMCRGYYIESFSEPIRRTVDEVTVVEHNHAFDNIVYMSLPTNKKPDVIVEIPEYNEEGRKHTKTHKYRLYK